MAKEEFPIIPVFSDFLHKYAAFALRRLVLPICVVEGEFAVAMADPADEATRALVAREAGRAVRAYQADPAQLREELLRLYGESRATTSTPAGWLLMIIWGPITR